MFSRLLSCLLLMTLLISGCSAPAAQDDNSLGAGFRYSSYGPPRNPGADYWVSVGEGMSAKFPGSHPEVIWILGTFMGRGSMYLTFRAETDDPHIVMGYVDMNEDVLSLFDKKGFKVWLQVEPADADMLTLINIVMNQYKHHPCVIGFGVDVEWYQSDGSPEGTPVSDATAEAWVKAVRKINPKYQIFLKHWDPDWLPPTYRDGIVFVDDSQHFESFDHMKTEFAAWGQHFAPAKVGFQYGYPADRAWWGELNDPPLDIGQALVENIPNTASLFWVDFTVFEIFPPQ